MHGGLVVLVVEVEKGENGMFVNGWSLLMVRTKGTKIGIVGVDGIEFVGPKGEVDDFGLDGREVMDVAVEVSSFLEGAVEDGVAYL